MELDVSANMVLYFFYLKVRGATIYICFEMLKCWIYVSLRWCYLCLGLWQHVLWYGIEYEYVIRFELLNSCCVCYGNKLLALDMGWFDIKYDLVFGWVLLGDLKYDCYVRVRSRIFSKIKWYMGWVHLVDLKYGLVYRWSNSADLKYDVMLSPIVSELKFKKWKTVWWFYFEKIMNYFVIDDFCLATSEIQSKK